MKCTNCGAELTGKFCTVCGTRAPEQAPQAEPMQYNPASEQAPQAEPMQYNPASEQAPQAEPMQYNPAPEQAPQAEPMQYNPAPEQAQQAEPVQYAQPTQTQDFSQQYQNYGGVNSDYQNGYTGQQFTNQQNNAVPQPKKSMSTGKIVALVLGIVGGVILLICILVGVAACSIIKSTSELIGNAYDYYESNDDFYDYYDDEFNLDDFMSYDNDVADTDSMITFGGEYRFVD